MGILLSPLTTGLRLQGISFTFLCFLHNRSWMSKGYRMNLMARKKVCAFCVWCIWFNFFFIQSYVTKTARCNVLCMYAQQFASCSFGSIRFASINLANLIEYLLLAKTLNIIVLYILFLFECAHPPSDQQFTCYYW